MLRVGISVNEAHRHGFEILGSNPGACLLECIAVKRADHLTAMVEPFRHLEAPPPAHQRRRALLIHIVKAHQPQTADFKQITKTFRRNQSSACTATLNYGVCRNGGAMDQLLDIVAGYARLPQHVSDTRKDRLGVIAARRQDLAGDKASAAGEEDEVGKGPADIDAEATRKISIHGLFITPAIFGPCLSDIA